jgi:sterol desaturase/sphingolipid hydroxylase (fatty acid hydroxylase superfamily)
VEARIRLGIFLGTFIAMVLLEMAAPRRRRRQSKATRWGINLGLTVINLVVARFTLGAAAYATAMYARQHGWGLLNNVGWPRWATFLFAILALDLAIYLQHVTFHVLPVFWRLHRVHHADLDYDVTTGLRFHPFEIIVSMIYKVALVSALGPEPWAVVAFEALLNASSMFHHSNVRLPAALDRVLRCLIVTPDMHIVHHSAVVHETNSNFSFCVSLWDRLFGTYRAAPAAGPVDVTIGVEDLRDPSAVGLASMIMLPFARRIGRYSLQSPDPDPGAAL